MKIVCDTNVLVSGILFGGNSRAILRLICRAQVINVISTTVLEECENVLLRRKFGLDQYHVTQIIALFRDTFELVIPSQTVTVVSVDPDDNRILEVAEEGNCDKIVSGDAHLLDLGEWKNIKIHTPAQFVAKMEH